MDCTNAMGSALSPPSPDPQLKLVSQTAGRLAFTSNNTTLAGAAASVRVLSAEPSSGFKVTCKLTGLSEGP